MGKVKIIAGALKGKTLKATVTKSLRPTSAKVRESLFNIIREITHGCRFLDLYAGTGAVGLEALSRGAKRVVFVDRSAKAIEAIVSIPAFKISGSCAAFVGVAKSVLKKLENINETFNCIYIDPPYYSDEIENIMPVIASTKVLTAGCHVILEHPAKKQLPHAIGNLITKKQYKYGDISLTVYEFLQD
ncbi:16S rRNA (guanine(966)-N(2))-methyltransferase RsmD [Candidatus Magnetomonas plexicatena]|uniref:16S rRNA (guanine(966)-N(2))-methyltransferase RsmD n=1 Tax=Candidatus Magnetomonas plexicatena TaxID=2552947 RepID=UPI001C751FA7|nr:16S rRNA (guanine(966)-N(2))-methyltransferase RsmD [Nitrospirales bacterium LBB_01]